MKTFPAGRKWFVAIAASIGLLTACLPPAVAEETEGTEAGLAWIRFNSPQFTRPSDTGTADRVDVDTGTTINDYSQIWLGQLQLPTGEPITFSAEADNGLRLFLDNRLILNAWGPDADRRATFQAEQGKRVPLRLDYFQNGGVGYVRLYWQWPGHDRELIPASVFSHTVDQQNEIQAMSAAGSGVTTLDRSIIYQPEEHLPGPAPESDLPIPARPGPHLLLDDYLIAESRGVERVICQPKRDPEISNPIVTAEDRSFQPFLAVLPDAENGGFRIWYGASREDRDQDRSHLATMRSEDGIHFIRPYKICETPEIQFGSTVIDRGSDWPDPAARYVYCYWLGGGTRILASPDGLRWHPLVEGIVLPHDHDITGIRWDPILQTYAATVSTYTTGANWSGKRRTTMMSFSRDLVHWEPSWFVLTASDKLDEGETQFYAMDGYLTRGGLRIGMVKVLRDDLRAAGTQSGSFGRAHTSLAWSRDGRTWVRDRGKFFEPDDDPAAWDHAHAWIDDQLIRGDEVYLYYAGYKQGHKMNRFEERQIGLVKMPLDRYVARRASGSESGRLTTVPIRLDDPTGELTVNADADRGRLRVQVRDAETGQVLPGLSFDDSVPITADGLRQSVRWRNRDIADLAGRTVQLEFELRDADLFAFQFERP